MTDTNEKIEPPPGMSPEATRWVAGRVVPFLRAQAVAAGLAVDDEATPWQWVNGADPVDLLHAMVAAGLVVGVQPATRAAAPLVPLDNETRSAVSRAVMPHLRAIAVAANRHVDEDASARDWVMDSHPDELLDALNAAGLLVSGDYDDRAYLRGAWAATTRALAQLSARREVDADVIHAVPVAHRGYLQGHAATYRQLAELWERIEAATELVAALSVPASDDEPTYGTRGQLVAVLDILRGAEQTIAVQRRDVVAKVVTPAPLVDLDAEVAARSALLDRMVEVRARLKPCDVWATPELAPHLAGQTVPPGARVYAAAWPEGTRAFASGELAGPVGAGATVASRYLYVDLDGKVTPESVFVGRMRRLHPEEMTREKSRWWRCRYCRMGATGAVSVAAEQAERLGHEAICPDRDAPAAEVTP